MTIPIIILITMDIQAIMDHITGIHIIMEDPTTTGIITEVTMAITVTGRVKDREKCRERGTTDPTERVRCSSMEETLRFVSNGQFEAKIVWV